MNNNNKGGSDSPLLLHYEAITDSSVLGKATNMEIIATLRDYPFPKSVKFSELFGLSDNLVSLLLLWNNNSYYVDAPSRTFMINGGRRTRFNNFTGGCRIIYRKRNQMELSVDGEVSVRRMLWLIGLEDNCKNRILLKINEDGTDWAWATGL